MNFGTDCDQILVKKRPSCMFWILVHYATEISWKKDILYVMNLSPVCEQIFVKKKDPSVCPEFWYGRGHNSGEKERPSCMSWILAKN